MKKILFCAFAACLTLAGCVRETPATDPARKPFRLQLSVDPIGSDGAQTTLTRATVPAMPEEENIQSLVLLFFDYTTDKSGEFVAAYTINSPTSGASYNLEIGYGEGELLSHTKSYSILAYANIPYSTAVFSGQTEASCVSDMDLSVMDYGAPVRFLSDNLPMSGRTTKMASQEVVDLHLSRLVARLDVINEVEELYELKNVTIFGAQMFAGVWDNEPEELKAAIPFYGTANSQWANVVDGKVEGGLYVFENFVGDPMGDPENTTSLVVELAPREGLEPELAEKLIGTPGESYYYRLDIRPEESAQNIMRNNIYVASIRGVLGNGATSLSDANDNPGGLDVVINNWSMDDEGMIVTDGQSTMAVPSKIIHFGPKAQSRKFTIFTTGPGALSIAKSNLPNGMSAELVGNELTVTVTSYADYEERRGTFELGYGGLRGTVTVVQTMDEGEFLELDKSVLEPWNSDGSDDVTVQNRITVAASGQWVAKIYNTSLDGTNPGFSFSDGSVDVETTGGPGDAFDIYSTGANPDNDFRQGFVVVTLADNNEYSRVAVLTQNAKGNMRISPSYTALPFDAVGNASGVIGDDPVRPEYRIDIFPGRDNPENPLREWDFELGGTDASKFAVTRVDDPHAPYLLVSALGDNPSYPGVNISGPKEAWLKIGLMINGSMDTDVIELPITQEQLTFSIRRISALERVPVDGTERITKVWANAKHDEYARFDSQGLVDYVEYEVVLHPALKYDVEITGVNNTITEQLPYRRHAGYLIDGNGQKTTNPLTDQPASRTIRVGFDKIYYPMVHWAGSSEPNDNNIPEVQISVSIAGMAIGGVETANIQQEPLVAQPLNMVVGTYNAAGVAYEGYGSFSATGVAGIITDWPAALFDTGNFGPNGEVKMPNTAANAHHFAVVQSWQMGKPVSEGSNYIHASSYNGGIGLLWTDGAMKAVEDWRISDDTQGFVVFNGLDEAFINAAGNPYTAYGMYPFTNTYSTLNVLGYDGTNPHHNNNGNEYSIGTVTGFDTAHSNKRLMQYVMNGPFGEVADNSSISMAGGVDVYHASVRRNSLGENAVVLMTEATAAKNNALITFDPVARVAMLGEVQLFENRFDNTPDEINSLNNIIAIVVNAAMYGDHFLELLYEKEIPGFTQPSLYIPYEAIPVVE